MEHQNENNPFTEVTMEVIAAQAFVFFLAGFETSSTTMTFCLYELALNPDIQERVRNEIDTVLDRHGGNITYESVFEMEYLDKVVSGKSIKSYVLNRSMCSCISIPYIPKLILFVIRQGLNPLDRR
jgi:cytochrome P450 family 6